MKGEEVEAREQQMKDFIEVHVALKELFYKLDKDQTGFLTGQAIDAAVQHNTGGIKELMQKVRRGFLQELYGTSYAARARAGFGSCSRRGVGSLPTADRHLTAGLPSVS